MNPPRRTDSGIRQAAREAGIDAIGICDSSPLDDTRRAYDLAIERGYIPAETAPRKPTLIRLTTPGRHLKGARSVVSACQSYYTGKTDGSDPTSGIIAPYTRCNYYEDLRLRLEQVASFMRQTLGCRTKVFSCYVTLAEKPLAYKAGLGFYGKNGVIISPDFGSFVVLGEVVTDLEIEPDAPLADTCGKCTLCMEACPTGAISEPYFVDRNRCIQNLSATRTIIPPEIREIWRNRLYGCTTCQDACPYNGSLTPVGHSVNQGVIGPSLPLAGVMSMDETTFRATFANNQIGRRERNVIRRNAVIAAGSSRSEALLPALTMCTGDPDPMIRQHSMWAVFKIKGRSAGPMLARALKREDDPQVIAELKTLLDGGAEVA